jgi:hypothetical protein
MKTRVMIGLGVVLAGWCAGCGTGADQANPFLTLAEKLGGTEGQSTNQNSSSGGAAQAQFRAPLTITFRNNHTAAELNTTLVAWVELSSVRTAEQQEELLNDGYIQLPQELRLGSAYVLPIGTYVYYGPGTAGGTPILLLRATADTGGGNPIATSQSYTLITPDVILVYAQPPVSCENVAFFYTDQGELLPSGGGSTQGGPLKTLAQVNLYECNPFRPGLFVRLGGGARQLNEFVEGEAIAFDFNPGPDAAGNFCIVTVGAEATTTP